MNTSPQIANISYQTYLVQLIFVLNIGQTTPYALALIMCIIFVCLIFSLPMLYMYIQNILTMKIFCDLRYTIITDIISKSEMCTQQILQNIIVTLLQACRSMIKRSRFISVHLEYEHSLSFQCFN